MEWMTAAECADWWNKVIGNNVERVQKWSESQGYDANTTVGFCLFWGTNSVQTGTDILLLDNLKLGQGAGDASTGGSKWGYLADVGRLTAFIPLFRAPGAIGKVVSNGTKAEQSLAKSVQAAGKGGQATRLTAEGEQAAMSGKDYLLQVFKLKDPASLHGICWAISMAQALRHTGRYWARVEDIAKLLNVSRGASMFDDLEKVSITALKQLKVILDGFKVKCVFQELDAFRRMGHNTMQMLEIALPRLDKARGVLLFGVRWISKSGEEVGHVLYAFRDAQGILKIADRSGEVVTSFAQLEKFYPGIAKASAQTVDAAIFIHEASIPQTTREALRNMGPLGNLMIPLVLAPAAMAAKGKAKAKQG